MKKENPTNYQGSQKTAQKVEAQIIERYGADEARNYNPLVNCRTFRDWINNGFKVKKGEKALKSYIVLERKNKKNEIERRIKTINLFYVKQVEPLN